MSASTQGVDANKVCVDVVLTHRGTAVVESLSTELRCRTLVAQRVDTNKNGGATVVESLSTCRG